MGKAAPWRAVDEDEDATLAHTEESTAIEQPCRGFTGRIGVDCCASEHLSTFHHCTSFTRLFRIQYGRMFRIRQHWTGLIS